MSNPYTVIVRLSELFDIIERFDSYTKANHIHIQGSYIYFAQSNDREDFSIAKSILLANGSSKTGSFTFEYDIKRLARWVKDAMGRRVSLFSPMSMMVRIVVQNTRVSFELENSDLNSLEITYRDASATGTFSAPYLSFINASAVPLAKTDNHASVSVPMHLILPYSTYKANIRKPLPLSIFGYEGHAYRIGFTFDGLIGTYGARGISWETTSTQGS